MEVNHKSRLRELGYDGEFDQASLQIEQARLKADIAKLQQRLVELEIEVIQVSKE